MELWSKIEGHKTVAPEERTSWLPTEAKSIQIDSVDEMSKLVEDLIAGTDLLTHRLKGQDQVTAERMHFKALMVLDKMNLARRLE